MTENLTSINLNGDSGQFTGLQRFVSPHMSRTGDLYNAKNVDLFENPGRVKIAKGYVKKGSDLSSSIRGIYSHMFRDGESVSFVISGNKPYVWNGTAWNAGSTTFTNSNRSAMFCSFLNRSLMVDGQQTLSSGDGSTWNSSLFTNAPANCHLIERFETRIILANQTEVFWSSLPNDTLDDVTWNTTDWNVIPETDDGDYITSIKRFKKRLLIFKNYSIQRMFLADDTNPDLLTVDENIGCPIKQNKGLITYGDYVYFFGTTRDGEAGIYMTAGERAQQISRPIQDIIRAIPQNNYSKIRAGLHDGIIKFFVGDITLDGELIPNCEIQHSPRDRAWQYRSLSHSVNEYAPLTINYENKQYFVTDKSVMLDDTGTTFDGNIIHAVIETPLFPIEEIDAVGELKRITISCENSQSLLVQFSDNSKPANWETLNNTTTRPDLFLGKTAKKSTLIRLKISMSTVGTEIHKIRLGKAKNTKGEIYDKR